MVRSNLKLKFILSFIFSLSLSTLSVSSGSVSSRGSLGSLASLGSTGSLASLSLTDIYMQGIGYQVTNTSLQDLYRRVENLLQGHSRSISPSSSVSASSQQGINALTGSGNHHPLPVPSSASTSGAHSQSSLDNVGSNASSNTQLNKATGGSLENLAELNAALSSSPYLRRVVDHPHPHPHLPTSSGASPVPSPPISPHGLAPPPPPPSYEQHVRQRLMGEEQTPPTTTTGHGAVTNDNQYHPPHAHQNAHALLINRPFTGTNNSGFGGIVPQTAHRGHNQHQPPHQQYHHTPLTENMDALLTGGGVCKRTLHDTAAETPLGSNPPLSPISESSSGVCNNLSGGNTRSVSAAVSDESVAGDSGVFEVSIKK